MIQIVAIDIGGTHARFALAEIEDGRVVSLGPETVFDTAKHANFHAAWEAYLDTLAGPAPSAAAIAVAAPVTGEVVRFTNNPWTIRPSSVAQDMGLCSHVLLNDFAAVAHAVAQADDHHFVDVCLPTVPLPATGTICVVGPGTGLGVAQLYRGPADYTVMPTEGGHIGFAPTDEFEDFLLRDLRARFGRVSAERVVSGSGLGEIYRTLGAIQKVPVRQITDVELWSLALSGTDSLAAVALDHFCMALGSVAGDLALAQGASAVVIAGGLGYRLRNHLLQSGFVARFTGKGRFESLMKSIPVKVIVHPQPGLFGAAAAFAASV